ncbi:hypothetical protein PMAYCL1PPCAC_18412, partial [Pristionchus mayeri]
LQPNIYLCPRSSLCCTTRLHPACCEKDVTAKHALRQSIPFVAIFILFIAFATIVHWYLDDPDIEEEVVDEDAFKKKIEIKNILLPSDEDVVDDPVFGRIWEEKAPR